jgi:hypothetical protein
MTGFLGPPAAESAAPPVCSCGAEMFWAECHMLDCWDGEYDLHDEDAINYAEGTWAPCGECDGKGGYWVCDDSERHRSHKGASKASPPSGGPK